MKQSDEDIIKLILEEGLGRKFLECKSVTVTPEQLISICKATASPLIARRLFSSIVLPKSIAMSAIKEYRGIMGMEVQG